MKLHPVILAGGSGTRLWPLSRKNHPKQFLRIADQLTLLQGALCRLDGMRNVAEPLIVCNEEHRFLVAEQVRQLGKRPWRILLESVGKNTAPALTMASFHLSSSGEDSDTDPVMLVMPSDQVINNVEAFQNSVKIGEPLAQEGNVVTFGVLPTDPNTGYGYLRKGDALAAGETNVFQSQTEENGDGKMLSHLTSFNVTGFEEKPGLKVAQSYVDSGDYLWNSGIFMMRISVWLDLIQRYQPEIYQVCRLAYNKGQDDGDFYRFHDESFAQCPSRSIDRAVIERITGRATPNGTTPETLSGSTSLKPQHRCVMVPLDAEWADVGTWSGYLKNSNPDDHGNVIKGDVYAKSVYNSILISQNRLLAVAGLEDVVVVETPDAVLVAQKDAEQDMSIIVKELIETKRAEFENHRKVHRPWGYFESVIQGPGFQVKLLMVNPGSALSLQLHRHRAEHWVVVRGTAKVTNGDEELLLRENESTYVPMNTIHRLENHGQSPLLIIEVQCGSYLGEDDIIRFEDRYNRHQSTAAGL